MEKDNKSDNLKVLRVGGPYHIIGKVNAAKQGIKLQAYIEALLKADEQGLVDWSRLKK